MWILFTTSLALDPVTGNFRLDRAADDGHVDWMLKMDRLGHSGSGGSSAGVRMDDDGSTVINAQETSPSLGQARTSVLKTTLKYLIATSSKVMVTGSVFLDPDMREVAIRMSADDFYGMDATFATQNFGRPRSDRFSTGVAWCGL